MDIELCRHLRWKSPTRETASVDEIALAYGRNQVPYSCLHTCQPWGPDDELAAPEMCCSGRGCFEASALTKRVRSSEPIGPDGPTKP